MNIHFKSGNENLKYHVRFISCIYYCDIISPLSRDSKTWSMGIGKKIGAYLSAFYKRFYGVRHTMSGVSVLFKTKRNEIYYYYANDCTYIMCFTLQNVFHQRNYKTADRCANELIAVKKKIIIIYLQDGKW